MISYRQENERMLAAALGVEQEEAAKRLEKSVAITAADDPAAQRLALEVGEQLARTIHIAREGEADLEVAIGRPPAGRSKNVRYADVDEQGLRVSARGPEQPSSTELDGFRMTFAGCYAAAPILRQVLALDSLGYVPARDPFLMSFANLGIPPDILDQPVVFDSSALAGAGAVGNGFLRALRHLPVQGSLAIVDPKRLGPGNANRCLYFREDEPEGQKAEILSARAQADFQNLRLAPYVGTFSDFVRTEGRVRQAIVGTDSRRVRRAIQTDLPWEVVDASTTDIREIIVHSHRQPTENACLACIYRHIREEQAREQEIARGLGVEVEDVALGLITPAVAAKIVAKHRDLELQKIVGMAFDSLFKERCAEQKLLTATGVQVLAPFAFVSNLAGAFLALELARLSRDGDEPMRANYMFASPWATPSLRTRLVRPRHPECSFCAKSQSRQALFAVWSDRMDGSRQAG